MTLFITSLIILATMLFEKIFFYSLEKDYASSYIGTAEIILYTSCILAGIIFFIKNYFVKSQNKIEKKILTRGNFFNKFNFLTLFFTVATIASILVSLYINFAKVSIHWDAVALYDARAKFIEGGMTFSEMPSLSKFDNLNKYYYLLYPPYTSIAHYIWKTSYLTEQIPLSVFYSIVMIFLSIVTFITSRERFGLLIATIITFLIVSNSSMFNITIKEYTNLPFDLYIVVGAFLLYEFIKTNELWKYIFGVLMVSSSIWVRLLEPIWLGVIIAFLIATFKMNKKVKSISLVLFFLVFSLLQYFSWSYFTSSIAHNPSFLNFTALNILDTFVALFTGAPQVVMITIAKSWGVPFLIHICALIGLILRFKYVFNNKPLLFLGGIILTSIGIYFLEFYAISFQADWWHIVTLSIDRSSTFMIPISAIILFDLALSSNLFKKKTSQI